MRVEILNQYGTWRAVADACRTTVGLEPGTGEPSDAWKLRLLRAEHSPIRLLTFSWRWVDLPSWVSVHFVRHHVGIDQFVRSQRSDRTGIDRNKLPQDAPVIHQCSANAQAIINVSRKRLCLRASKETRQAWNALIEALMPLSPALTCVCVPECVYRGFCPEVKSCGYALTREYMHHVADYRGV